MAGTAIEADHVAMVRDGMGGVAMSLHASAARITVAIVMSPDEASELGQQLIEAAEGARSDAGEAA